MTPHLNCKIGDHLSSSDERGKRHPALWVVTGINTVSGDVWIEACDGRGHVMQTITVNTAHQWSRRDA